VVGIEAALDFAATNPASARAVTLESRDREDEVIHYFAGLLEETTPSERPFPIFSYEAIIASIITLVRGHQLAGTTSQLPGLLPDLVYLTLMPYTGLPKARQLARSLERSHIGGTA
jgi:hypothetical protein